VNDQLHRLALKLIVVSFLNLLLFHGTLSLYFELISVSQLFISLRRSRPQAGTAAVTASL
jgi:hypothetical protein